MKKNLWAMPEEEFKEFVSEITVSDAFLNIMTFGPSDITDEDRESLFEIVKRYGFRPTKMPELTRLINNIYRRLLAP